MGWDQPSKNHRKVWTNQWIMKEHAKTNKLQNILMNSKVSRHN